MKTILTKKNIIVFLIMVTFTILSIVFVCNDYFLYKEPILKITNISETSYPGYTENSYVQVVTGVILNGVYKGKTYTFNNNYSYSEVYSDRLTKGTEVFLEISKDGESIIAMSGINRDKFIAVLLIFFIDLILLIAGAKGLKTIVSLIINIIITIISIMIYRNNNHVNLLLLYMFIASLYIVLSLLITNKRSKKVLAAIVSSFISIIISFSISYIIVKIYDRSIPYWTMEYIDSIFDYHSFFYVSILLCGLGAIMDVSITMASSLNELILKDSEISSKALIKSGKEISKDITGTMINVMLFTMYVSMIPTLLIAFKNGISIATAVKYYGTIELISVLSSCISIVLTIPISLFTSVFIYKKVKVGDRK